MNFKEYLTEVYHPYGAVKLNKKDTELREQKEKQLNLSYSGWGVYRQKTDKDMLFYAPGKRYRWSPSKKDFVELEKSRDYKDNNDKEYEPFTRKKEWKETLLPQKEKLGLKYYTSGIYKDKSGIYKDKNGKCYTVSFDKWIEVK
jgi:hypothetical protein